jgi:hypothetical protein
MCRDAGEFAGLGTRRPEGSVDSFSCQQYLSPILPICDINEVNNKGISVIPATWEEEAGGLGV